MQDFAGQLNIKRLTGLFYRGEIMAKLTPKQQKFCDFYIKTGNATESAIQAGYKKSSAYSVGSENLRKPEIKEYIAKRSKSLENERIASMGEVKEFWTSLLRNKEKDDKDRLKASEYIAKTNGAFLDKVEHSGGLDIKVNWD